MGHRSLGRRRARPTSCLLGFLLLALLFVGAALLTDVPSSDPSLSVLYTFDDEAPPVERPQPRPDSAPQAIAAEAPDLESHRAVVWAAGPPPTLRLAEAAASGGPATRAPPRA